MKFLKKSVCDLAVVLRDWLSSKPFPQKPLRRQGTKLMLEVLEDRLTPTGQALGGVLLQPDRILLPHRGVVSQPDHILLSHGGVTALCKHVHFPERVHADTNSATIRL